jgi:uncharacterized protein (TIGR00661 family)
MKVLFGIQTTGNGHIGRSIEVIRELKRYVEVDVAISGGPVGVDLPVEPQYHFSGLSYDFGQNGGFDNWSSLKKIKPLRFIKECRSIPVKDYHMVISDFEPLTAWAGHLGHVYTVQLSNQATFHLYPHLFETKKHKLARGVLRFFCPADRYYGYHFKPLGEQVFSPIIREEIRNLNPTPEGPWLVYLPCYSNHRIYQFLKELKEESWHVFSPDVKKNFKDGNVEFSPPSNQEFLKTLERAKGVLCTAGFGLSSESLFLRKNLVVVPMKQQVEQLFNANFLEEMGVPVLKGIKPHHAKILRGIIKKNQPGPLVHYRKFTNTIVKRILTDYIDYEEEKRMVKFIRQSVS